MIFSIGILAAIVSASVYLNKRGVLNSEIGLPCIGVGLALGIALLAALLTNYGVYTILMAGYVIYFMYLKDFKEFDRQTESTMVSLFAGIITGAIGLVGCIVFA